MGASGHRAHRQYDIWARQFLAVHEQATVVHLGCGLDSQLFRLDPSSGVEWYDVDYPAVIELRERNYPTRAGYQLIPTSATDPSWLSAIPAGRPVLLLAEGISMYLTLNQGVALLRHVVDRFPSGEVQMDFYNWVGIKTQKAQTLVRRSGSTLHWAVNGPDDILARCQDCDCCSRSRSSTPARSAGYRVGFALPGHCLRGSGPSGRRCNTTATLSAPSPDGSSGMLPGDAA